MPHPNPSDPDSFSVNEWTKTLTAAFQYSPLVFDITVSLNVKAALASVDLHHAYEIFQAAADRMAQAIIERGERKGGSNV